MVPRSLTARVAALLALVLAAPGIPAAQSTRRPLSHDDYDAWRSIFTPTLTRDGRFLIYRSTRATVISC